jgi:signal transduction histidine kinase
LLKSGVYTKVIPSLSGLCTQVNKTNVRGSDIAKGDGNGKTPSHHFVVDSGLKNIIGQELITNDFVAIYELVKNSLDAHATKVDLIVGDDLIIIADNGKGMLVNDDVDEIKSKWLRVAYSAKKMGIEDQNLDQDFREKIAIRKRALGGSKGVGRFSCDRLGKNLTLYTKTFQQATYNKLDISWNDFEDNDFVEFENVGVKRTKTENLPEDIKGPLRSANTILKISGLRNDWDYKKLQSLKKELAQLINPFEENSDIEIEIHAAKYVDQDAKAATNFGKVNGPIGNNIYQAIGLSTTRIEVRLRNGSVHTKLTDRGELIYEIQEKSDFEHIDDIPINIDLSFLNRAAKTRFTRFMGISALEFGHVFLFKNGYRVMPYGVPGNDMLGYDARKGQGQMRYLGSRDLLGQINILDNSPALIEPSSRDGGLIKNAAYSELENLFKKNALVRLEAYVVGITYSDRTDKDKEDSSGIYKEESRIGVIRLINRLVSNDEIEIVNYHKELVDIIDEKSSDFTSTIKNLKKIATVSKNAHLLSQIKSAELKYSALEQAKREAEELSIEARKTAAEENVKANIALEAQKLAEEKLETEIKRSLFLKSLTEVDVEDVIGLSHQVVYDATNIKNTVNDALERISLDSEHFNGSVALQILQSISLSNQKILLASQFATRANFRHRSDGITEDMVVFLRDYILVSVNPNALNIDVTVDVDEGIEFPRTFKPLELSIIIDNFVSNAQKARAPHINFKISMKDDALNIIVSDDGDGLGAEIDNSRIFDLAYSGTQGSGIGLYHIRSVLLQLNGTVQLLETSNNEARFLVEIKNEN